MKEKQKHNLVNIADINPTIILDLRYATNNNFTGEILYSKAICYLHKDVAKAIDLVQKELQKLRLSLKIFDSYRPLSVQQKMWELIQDERFVANPAKSGSHTRGTAVDVTLERSGKELAMPTLFDEFTERAASNYDNLPKKVLENRALLKEVMGKYGFEQSLTEWWHFNFIRWEDNFKYPPLNFTFEELECN